MNDNGVFLSFEDLARLEVAISVGADEGLACLRDMVQAKSEAAALHREVTAMKRDIYRRIKASTDPVERGEWAALYQELKVAYAERCARR